MDSKVTRCLNEVLGKNNVRIGIDLVSAARRNIGFLSSVDASTRIHEEPAIAEAIKRYEELWMPLMSYLTSGSTPAMVLPPVDIEWIWFCHILNPAILRIEVFEIDWETCHLYDENEEYAQVKCREIWTHRYPSKPFINEVNSGCPSPSLMNGGLFDEVLKQRSICLVFSEPYMNEVVYSIAATQRYKGFLHILARIADEGPRFKPPLIFY